MRTTFTQGWHHFWVVPNSTRAFVFGFMAGYAVMSITATLIVEVLRVVFQ